MSIIVSRTVNYQSQTGTVEFMCWVLKTKQRKNNYYLRIPRVRTDNVLENCPTPTLFKPAKRTSYDVYCLRGEITKGPRNKMQVQMNKQQNSDMFLLFSYCVDVKLLFHVYFKTQCCTCDRNSGLFPFLCASLPPLQNKVCNLCSSINWQSSERKEGWGWARWDCHIVRHVWLCFK